MDILWLFGENMMQQQAVMTVTLMFVGHSYRAFKKLLWVIILPLLCLLTNASQRNDFCFMFQLQLCSIQIRVPNVDKKSWTGLVPQVLEEESTSHLRIANGISRASPAPSARSRWWALVFSRPETRSCAVNATATFARYREVAYRVLTRASTKLLNFNTRFKNPSWWLGERKRSLTNTTFQRWYCEGSGGCCLHQIFIQELL